MSETKRVIDIPEEVALVMHLLQVTSYGLAKAASEQPEQARGHDPNDLVEFVLNEVFSEFVKKPDQEKDRLINHTLRFVGKTIDTMNEGMIRHE